MDISNLLIEVTRRCNLSCEHCLRGDSQNKKISDETLVNTFKDIKRIRRLVITGGEPLLVVDKIEKIIELVRSNNITIDRITLITNGTVMSSRILKALRDLSLLSTLDLKISHDIFHALELERKNLKGIRDKNAEIFKELFNAEDYGEDTRLSQETQYFLVPKGRTMTTSKKRLREIEKMMNIKFVIEPSEFFFSELCNYDSKGVLRGKVSIDVNGNIVKYECSFDEEDEYARETNTNINECGLHDAIENYMEKEQARERYIVFY